MLFLLYATISSAISVSRIRDSDVWVFSDAVSRFAIVCSRRFWTAPSLLLCADTFLIAASIVVVAFWVARSTLFPSTPSAAALISSIVNSIVWPSLAPIWSSIPLFEVAEADCLLVRPSFVAVVPVSPFTVASPNEKDTSLSPIYSILNEPSLFAVTVKSVSFNSSVVVPVPIAALYAVTAVLTASCIVVAAAFISSPSLIAVPILVWTSVPLIVIVNLLSAAIVLANFWEASTILFVFVSSVPINIAPNDAPANASPFVVSTFAASVPTKPKDESSFSLLLLISRIPGAVDFTLTVPEMPASVAALFNTDSRSEARDFVCTSVILAPS